MFAMTLLSASEHPGFMIQQDAWLGVNPRPYSWAMRTAGDLVQLFRSELLYNAQRLLHVLIRRELVFR